MAKPPEPADVHVSDLTETKAQDPLLDGSNHERVTLCAAVQNNPYDNF
jgi:hypothetical protein